MNGGQRDPLCYGLDRNIFVIFARDGYQSCRGDRVQPHYNQWSVPGFPISRLLSDRIVDRIFLILGVNHVEVPTMVSRNPDFTSSDELPSLIKGVDALQRGVFHHGLQITHDRYSQGMRANAVGVEVDRLFFAPYGGGSMLKGEHQQ